MNDDEIKALADLLKADDDEKDDEGKDDEGKEEDKDFMKKKHMKYDDKYMAKHFKRFMKENKEDVGKYAEQLGLLKKALDDVVEDIEGIEEADATLVEGTEFFKAFTDLAGKMVDSFNEQIVTLNEKVDSLAEILGYNQELAKASADVLIKTAEKVEDVSEEPLKRKGVDQGGLKGDEDKGKDSPLQKAADLSFIEIKRLVLKAAQDGNNQAAGVVTDLDCCGGNYKRLPDSSLLLIEELAGKEQ